MWVMLDWQVTRRQLMLQKLPMFYLTVSHSDYNSLIRIQAEKQGQLR